MIWIKRALLFLVLFIFVIPPLILTFKAKRRQETYEILSYMVLSKHAAQNADTKLQKIKNLFSFVHENLSVPSDAKVMDTSVLNDFIRGVGWCDQQSFSLATLLAFQNVPARYLMLRNSSGSSPHTVAEIFYDNEWKIIDPLSALFFTSKDSKSLISLNSIKLEEVENNERLVILKKYYPKKYQDTLQWYSQMFPKQNEAIPDPNNGISMYHYYIKYPKRNIISKILNFYWDLVGDRFIYIIQDLYLMEKLSKMKPEEFNLTTITEDFELFYKARNYHLFHRYERAEKTYLKLIKQYSTSEFADDALYFLGLSYVEQNKPQLAINSFNTLNEKYAQSGWVAISHYFKGKALEKLNLTSDALIEYSKAADNLETSALERYDFLSTTISPSKSP